MRKHKILTFLLLANLLLLADFLVFGGVQQLIQDWAFLYKSLTTVLFWVLSIALVVAIFLTFFRKRKTITVKRQRYSSWLVAALLMSSIPKLFFLMLYGLGEAGKWVFNYTLFSDLIASRDMVISDSDLIMTELGIMAAFIPVVIISHGIIWGRYRVKIQKEVISLPHLPKAFEGLRIVHLSDLHLGSFHKKTDMVTKAVQMVNGLNPDIICFTGDMVNNHASETEGWVGVFQQLKARYGKYAVLGNHDYGDYCQWPSRTAKLNNRFQIIDFFRACDFQLLLNENHAISINGSELIIVGVENWGKPPFQQYGDLDKAMKGIDQEAFKILLSHDPSHWDYEVRDKTNISVTLSGHTHGAQFGLGIGNKKWSPVKMKYPRWGGLYEEFGQYLYVNRGLGFIGFPGRVGMPPEITFLELKRAK